MVFIGLGGNEEGTLKAFQFVRDQLRSFLKDLRCASLYRTSPQLDEDQADFLNTMICGYFQGAPEDLLELLLSLENQAGRVRDPSRPKGPRILDLDLILFADQIVKTPRLNLPHPGLYTRKFVLEPLLELSDAQIDPNSQRPLVSFYLNVEKQGVYRLAKNW